MKEERFKTSKNVFDMHTERSLFKLSSQGHFHHLEAPVSIGKEANIFTAVRADSGIVIVKIYRLETCDFNKMYDYIKYDPRFLGLNRRRRDVIFAWCKREYRNLLKARDTGVSCPKPIAFNDNVLVIEFIGSKGGIPSLKMKDELPNNKARKERFCNEVIDNMAKLKKAGLVHGDLSEFNILNKDSHPVFIDFSQCSPLQSANANELMNRDIRNIARFFSKLDLKVDEEKIKEKIKKA